MKSVISREFYIPRGAVKVTDKASDAVAYLHEDKRARPCATIFFGAQARPVFDYAYRDRAARELAVRQAFEARRDHKARINAGRANKSPIALRNAAAKRVLEAAFGKGTVKIKGGTGTAYGWLHVRFSFPRKGGTGDGTAEVVKLLEDAGVEVGRYDSSDYGKGREVIVSWSE